eukprot:CAMPEP_0172497294 /NCGR_PEP_ID=MMETSP1066-20121228/97763_1 /TAXON_ID=671091 /ORGANISM="Coscinodiscus wailesii, Strain CCMP2513" /LENGTH=180 /DNA_ID=CAMNT_0013269965 /DNA_START=63 /DNA_END=605 /DNA_ORIENTATION=+
MKPLSTPSFTLLLLLLVQATSGFTLSRRDAFVKTASIATGGVVIGTQSSIANAGPTIYTTDKGVKYAILKEAGKGGSPLSGDIVAVEYTGYLTSGKIFDATHAEGKGNSLLFKLGTGSVIPGLDDMVSQMVVGQKVQAIVPPSLAYGDKGVCLDSGECLIKPGETLVYDIYLKKATIPPP